jgi:hypothetical protein
MSEEFAEYGQMVAARLRLARIADRLRIVRQAVHSLSPISG